MGKGDLLVFPKPGTQRLGSLHDHPSVWVRAYPPRLCPRPAQHAAETRAAGVHFSCGWGVCLGAGPLRTQLSVVHGSSNLRVPSVMWGGFSRGLGCC